MPPPMMTTSYSFIAPRMRDSVSTHHLCNLSPFANSALSAVPGVGVALFLELHHRAVGGHFDFSVHDGPLGYRDGARADFAADDRCITDLQLTLDAKAPEDGAGDDRLLCPDVAVPGSGGREIQRSVQRTVAVNFAGNHELAAAADIADEYRIGADEGRRGRVAVQKSAFFLRHGPLLSYRLAP